MAVARRFLIASSLTRLVRKERGSERVVEGHFAPQGERQSRVRIERGQAYLVLTSLDSDPNSAESWTDVPRSHAEALIEVCPGTVVFERSRLGLNGHEALVDRFMTPGGFDLVSVEFATPADAENFVPPVWFGPEVTGDDSYTNREIAISGAPHASDMPLSNEALESVLDLIESRTDGGQFEQAHPEERAEDTPFDRLRRLAAVRPASPLPLASTLAINNQSQDRAEESVAQFRRRRAPVAAPERELDGDERLAGVIQGLSEVLAQSPAEKDERFGA